MKIIAVLNQKGGSGKTTLSINLARGLQLKNKKVMIVDSDPQGSARDWNAANDGKLIHVVGLDRNTLDKDIKAISSDYDYVIIDGAPQLADLAVAAIKCADAVLIPVQPSPYDIWASADLVDVIKARQNITDGTPKAAFVVSRQIINTVLGNEIRDALKGYDLPIFKHGTYQRVLYPKSAVDGSTVLDKEENGDAAKDINLIIKELEEFLK